MSSLVYDLDLTGYRSFTESGSVRREALYQHTEPGTGGTFRLAVTLPQDELVSGFGLVPGELRMTLQVSEVTVPAAGPAAAPDSQDTWIPPLDPAEPPDPQDTWIPPLDPAEPHRNLMAACDTMAMRLNESGLASDLLLGRILALSMFFFATLAPEAYATMILDREGTRLTEMGRDPATENEAYELPVPDQIRLAETFIRRAHPVLSEDYDLWGPVADMLNEASHIPGKTGLANADWRRFNRALALTGTIIGRHYAARRQPAEGGRVAQPGTVRSTGAPIWRAPEGPY